MTTTLTPKREAEIRARDMAGLTRHGDVGDLLAALDATRAELAEVRAAAQAFHAHEDAGAVEAMLTSQSRNSEAYGMAWDVLRLLRGEAVG